jgi:hypothetical protein
LSDGEKVKKGMRRSAMLDRTQRPLNDEDLRVLDRYRQNAVGTNHFEPKYMFLAGLAGLVTGIFWIFHWGDQSTSFWQFAGFVGFIAAGAAAGFPFDYLHARKKRREREAAAAARWDPVVAVGFVEHLVAEASKAVRIDDNHADSGFFLQVKKDQVLCVWDWVDDATERVEIDLIPGNPPIPLKISWTGKKLTPLRPKRKFGRGEREPEQCEILSGAIEELDDLLRREGPAKRKPAARKPAPPATPFSKLADDVEPLGFYKYIPADQVSGAKEDIGNGAYDWYLGAGRAFDADAERLAEGGVKDLLDFMGPALKVEGLVLPDINESYDADQGYVIRLGTDQHTMWGKGEGRKSWELTTLRVAGLINQWLAKAGSQERVHVLFGGEDAVFVLLTSGMREVIVKSGIFRGKDIPGLL